jgi:hypothetical protein
MNRLTDLDRQSAALRLRRLAPWGVLALLATGCLIDDNDKCGENQKLTDNGLRCVCLDGYVVTTGVGCAPAPPPDSNAPTGVGKPCASDADCAGLDADYCELFVSKTCLVKNCTVTPDSCYQGSECCSFAGVAGLETVPNICLATGLCMQ